ncbi:MAG: hypothetical protein A4S16_12075 [Proteobacteria bacterium SG_bin6]|nr:MAG: hypothetical protein A4S16_12075 [Proteobacteria bacterium SG_bin6]
MRLFPALLLLPAAALAAEKAPHRPLPRSVDGLPIGAIPPQELPATGCAAFLWTNTTNRALIAMASADPARIRFAPAGTLTDLVRTAQQGGGNYGFATHSDYAGGDYQLSLDIEIVERGDLSQGAVIPAGSLRIEKTGADTVIVPVVGIIGCAN